MSEQCEEGEIQDLLLRAEAAEAREKVKDEINVHLIEQREAQAAELRTLRAENERLRGMLTEVLETGEGRALDGGLLYRIVTALEEKEEAHGRE